MFVNQKLQKISLFTITLHLTVLSCGVYLSFEQLICMVIINCGIPVPDLQLRMFDTSKMAILKILKEMKAGHETVNIPSPVISIWYRDHRFSLKCWQIDITKRKMHTNQLRKSCATIWSSLSFLFSSIFLAIIKFMVIIITIRSDTGMWDIHEHFQQHFIPLLKYSWSHFFSASLHTKWGPISPRNQYTPYYLVFVKWYMSVGMATEHSQLIVTS